MAKNDPMHKGRGAYQDKDPGLRRVREDFQDKRGTYDINSNVEKNLNDSGDGGKTGPIRYGVD